MYLFHSRRKASGPAVAWRRAVTMVVTTSLAVATIGVPPASAHGSSGRLWWPGGRQHTVSVPRGRFTRPRPTAGQRAAAARAAHPYRIPTVSWPSGSGTAVLPPAVPVGPARSGRVVAGVAARAGGLPVTVASRDASMSAAHTVSVRIPSRRAAAAAGVSGVLVSLARTDGLSAPSPVSVTLDYRTFAAAYGGGWADRLKLVALPACALTTPQLAACRVQTPVQYVNDRAGQTLTAQVSLAGAMVLASPSTSSGSVGTYSATSLPGSGQWSAGGSSGDFTYSYPITLPPAPGGDAPDVSLSYDSGSVDGRTSATNAQASWIGDGWDYTPGYIERSYQPCSQDGLTNVTDLCWAGNEVQLSLGAHSSTLVRDDTTHTWKLKNDDGSRVVALSGESNGAWNGEAWEIIASDGTQYYFGLNHLPGTTSAGPATQSAWTEPVYCPHSGDGPPGTSCYSSSTGTNSFVAAMAWRWNLDYVVDRHGNLQTYNWTPETNYYQRGYVQGNGTGVNTIYTRGGYLSSISYGYRLSDAVAGAAPVDTVSFGVDERCLSTCATLDSTTASNWPDVPFDQICATQGATCSNYSPSFFTRKRLTSITTSVLSGGTTHPVDSYTLGQMFPAPQAGQFSNTTGGVSSTQPGDGTVAVMWLTSIQRTGQDTLGGGSAVPAPATMFVGNEMANRVDGNTTGSAALYRPRMDSITTSSGSQIVVSYADPQCSRLNNTMPASPDSDTMNCFPQYWTPTGGTGPVLDWFNKPQVTEVTVNDLVAPVVNHVSWSEVQITSYAYAGIAWHRDDSPLTPNAQRTWNQFRGYRTVTTTSGVASGVSTPTQTVTTYMQGMDGDHLASGATRSVSVTDSVGDNVTDSDWLYGKALETQSLLGVGGAVQNKTVNGPWTYASTATQAQADSMPSLVARMLSANKTHQYGLLHNGVWRSTETDTGYDTSARVVISDFKGDGSAAVPEVCTTTSYAQDASRNMLDFPDEVKAVQGACGTTPTTANTVGDTRSFYDSSTTLGTLAGPGDATTVDAVDSYTTGGAPVYATQASKQFDVYGRVTSATDADGHTTTTGYTTPGASPDQVTVTNPISWTTTATQDPARGTTISATDINGELTTETYDGLGELTAVWSPLHAQSAGAPADQKFAYTFGGASTPSTVSSSTLLDGGSYGTDVKIYDGSLRLIQDQAPTADGSAGRLLTDTHYNSLGQTVKATGPYVDTTAGPGTTLFPPASDSVIPRETETFYDGLGRGVRSLTVAKGVNEWSTLTAYPGVDETDATPPADGTATSTFTDALGRVTASWTYNTASPTGNRADAIATGYTYTAAGKRKTITDNAGNAWTYSYDLHQRQTQLADPGAGTSTTSYSPGGEILTVTDGRGSQLTYGYDALGRKTGEWNTTGNVAASDANKLAAWTYDTVTLNGGPATAKGQLTASNRYTNGATDATHTYTQTVKGYTVLYQPQGVTITIPSAEGALAGTYQSDSVYSTNTPLLTGTHYYAEGGLPREAVNYGHTPTGLITSMGGTYVYLNDVAYNKLGQVLQTNFGVYTAGTQFVRTETYDQPTARLLTMTDNAQNLTGALDSTAYTYNQAGAITSESDTQHAVTTPDTQCFTYDQQNRLTAAWTDTNGVTATAGDPTQPVAGLGGCNDTAPIAGKVTGGPAPYWQTYGYDPLGDRVTETNHDTSVTSTAGDITQTLSYPGNNGTIAAGQPSAVQTVTTTTSAGSTTSTYGYDTAGNTKTRAGQTLTYDPEGHTATVTNTAAGTTSSYTYDADGALLLQNDPGANQTILYLPYGEEILLNTASGAKTGMRYYTASPDGVTVVRSSSGAVNYELTDTLKTATTTVNYTTLAATTRYFDPYGNPRGITPTTWPDQHGYLGKPQDPVTGLSLLGARNYDPATGRFLTVDPLLETGDSRQMNGYSYAADNPVNGSDPNGLREVGEPGGSNQIGDDWWNDPSQNHYCDGCDPGQSPPTGNQPGQSPSTGNQGSGGGGGAITCNAQCALARLNQTLRQDWPTTICTDRGEIKLCDGGFGGTFTITYPWVDVGDVNGMPSAQFPATVGTTLSFTAEQSTELTKSWSTDISGSVGGTIGIFKDSSVNFSATVDKNSQVAITITRSSSFSVNTPLNSIPSWADHVYVVPQVRYQWVQQIQWAFQPRNGKYIESSRWTLNLDFYGSSPAYSGPGHPYPGPMNSLQAIFN